MKNLLGQVKHGKPVLVLQNLGVQWIPRWHYSVVVGYDLDKGKLLLRSGKVRRYHVDMHIFERTWQRSGHWAFIALKPGELPANGHELQYFHAVADFEKIRATRDSIKAYMAGLHRWPASKLLGMGLGNAYYQSAELEKAAQSYTRVSSMHPGYAPAHNNLAQVMMDQGKLESAKKHAEIAVTIGGDHQQQYQSTLDEILSRIATTNPVNGEKPLGNNKHDSRK
jgi:tetratricopeptide (TPR) repeat protein